MSRYQEYERLKVKASRYYGSGSFLMFTSSMLFILGLGLQEESGSPILIIIAGGLFVFSFFVTFWRHGIAARVKAMENRNFSESYVQQDIGMRQGPVQGYSSTPVTKTASIEAELQKLNDLRAKGIINDAEYAKMRAKLFE